MQEKSKEVKRRWSASHRKENSVATKKWRSAHPEQVRNTFRQWCWAHPDIQKARYHRRRSLKRRNGGSFTAEEWRDLCEKCENRCLRCGLGFQLTADHVIPLSKGGSNSIDNIQPLCKSCNSSKGTKSTDYRATR